MCEPLRGKRFLKGDDLPKLLLNKKVEWLLSVEDVKSAVEFYKKYRYNPELLMSEETEIFLVWIHLHDEGDFKTQKELDDSYNAWLFDYCFGDVIDGK